MNILVCVKQVPDTNVIKIDPVTNTLVRTGVPSILNPFDANAVEAALQLREAHGGSVTAITMGPGQAKAVLRECYAMGVDRVVLVSDRLFGGSDTLATSYILSNAIQKLGKFDMILCGKQAIDGDTGQVGPEIAEHLGISQVTNAAHLEVNNGIATAHRERDDGFDIVESDLPMVCTVVKSINTPRYPHLQRMIDALETDKVEMLTAADFPEINTGKIGLKGSPTKVKKTFTPPRKASGVRMEDLPAQDMVRQLVESLVESKLL